MRLHLALGLTLSATIVVPGTASPQEYCSDVLKYASRDESEEKIAITTADSIYNNHCEQQKFKAGQQASVGLEAVVKQIPFKFSGAQGSSEERMSAFCKTYHEARSSNYEYWSNTSTVVQGALKSWERCLELSRQSLAIRPDFGTERILIGLKRTGGEKPIFQGLGFKQGELMCKVPNSSKSKKTVIVDEDTRKELDDGSEYLIDCVRPGHTLDDGSVEYRAVEVTVKTSRGGLLLRIPPDRARPRLLATQFQSDLDDLAAKTAACQTAVDAVSKRINAVIQGEPGQTVSLVLGPNAQIQSDGQGGLDVRSGRINFSSFGTGTPAFCFIAANGCPAGYTQKTRLLISQQKAAGVIGLEANPDHFPPAPPGNGSYVASHPYLCCQQ